MRRPGRHSDAHDPWSPVSEYYLSWTAAQVDLKSLKLGAFSRAAFTLPTWVLSALVGDVRDLRVTVTLNTSGNAGSFLLDNLRGEP